MIWKFPVGKIDFAYEEEDVFIVDLKVDLVKIDKTQTELKTIIPEILYA